MPDLVISACLLGIACRYDGGSKPTAAVADLVRDRIAAGGRVVAVCPEELAGLGTPRPPVDLRGGDGHAVWDGLARVCRVADGADVTEAFLAGARRAAARAGGADEAVLKARSPSCGCGATEIEGTQRPGDGVFAALLRRGGVRVRSEAQTGA